VNQTEPSRRAASWCSRLLEQRGKRETPSRERIVGRCGFT
jgi:hypothetical protein